MHTGCVDHGCIANCFALAAAGFSTHVARSARAVLRDTVAQRAGVALRGAQLRRLVVRATANSLGKGADAKVCIVLYSRAEMLLLGGGRVPAVLCRRARRVPGGIWWRDLEPKFRYWQRLFEAQKKGLWKHFLNGEGGQGNICTQYAYFSASPHPLILACT